MKNMSFLVFVFFLAVLFSCSVNDVDAPEDEFSDNAVRNAVYSGPKYPSDFVTEDLSNVTLNYIQSRNIPSMVEPTTDNYDSALTLAQPRVEELGLDYNKLINGLSNYKYYEFMWIVDTLNIHPNYIFRVHKESYFESVKFGLLDENKFQILELGNINYRPLTTNFITEFFDLMWFYKHYNFGGAVVLKRTVTEQSDCFKYSFHFTHTSYGDYGVQDRIRLYNGIFEVDKISGQSKIEYNLIKEVQGNYN